MPTADTRWGRLQWVLSPTNWEFAPQEIYQSKASYICSKWHACSSGTLFRMVTMSALWCRQIIAWLVCGVFPRKSREDKPLLSPQEIYQRRASYICVCEASQAITCPTEQCRISEYVCSNCTTCSVIHEFEAWSGLRISIPKSVVTGAMYGSGTTRRQDGVKADVAKRKRDAGPDILEPQIRALTDQQTKIKCTQTRNRECEPRDLIECTCTDNTYRTSSKWHGCSSATYCSGAQRRVSCWNGGAGLSLRVSSAMTLKFMQFALLMLNVRYALSEELLSFNTKCQQVVDSSTYRFSNVAACCQNASQPQNVHFAGRSSIGLFTPDVCNAKNTAHIFAHNILADNSNTTIDVYVSCWNPELVRLQLYFGDFSMQLLFLATTPYNSRGTHELVMRTNGLDRAGQNKTREQNVTLYSMQMSVIRIQIYRNLGYCTIAGLFVGQNEFRCTRQRALRVHGNNVHLHKLVVVCNSDAQLVRSGVVWDFTNITTNALEIGNDCTQCPVATRRSAASTANSNTCEKCYTGLQTRVLSNSAWWNATSFMPQPEWAVHIPVPGNMIPSNNSGILRYSKRTDNGNMYLTNKDITYEYDNVLRLCAQPAQFVLKNLYIAVLRWQYFANFSVLETSYTWNLGDQIRIYSNSTLPPKRLSPIVLRRIGYRTWSPLNMAKGILNDKKITITRS